MSRHRNVRALDFQEEYGDTYGGDVYGHSVEDDHFCVSPSTAAEFMYDRSQQAALSTFMSREPQIPEEDEERSDSEDDTAKTTLRDSGVYSKPQLNDVDQAKLYSCLEELRNIIGESTPDHVLTDAVLQAGFDHEKALNAILCQQDAPKPQREPRNRKNRDDYCSLSESSEHLSDSSDIGGTVASPPQTSTVVLGVSNIKSRGFDNVGKAQPPPGFAAKTHPPGFRPKNCPPGFEPKGNADQLLKQSKNSSDSPNLSPAAFTNIDYCKENLHPNKDSRPKSGQQSFQDPGPSSSKEAAPSRLKSSTRPNLSALAAQFSSSPPSQAAASTGKPSTQQLNKASEMSLSQLAASHVKRLPNRSASQDNTSAADPLGSSILADESVNRSQSTENKQSLAHLAANNPPATLTGPASNDPPKTVNLSALAANIPPKTVSLASLAANTPPKTSNFPEIQKPKAISLSALAAGTSPKTVSLSSLAANTPPKTTSLASHAANTPPKTTSLASLASHTAPKTMSLANLASNTPPKTVSLASLAANTPPKTVSLSSLAANITPKTTNLASLASGTPPKTVTLSGLMVTTKSKTVEASQPAKSKPKAVNLAELASSMSPKAETTSKPSSMTAANLSTLASNVSIPGIKPNMASSSVPPGFTNKSVSQQDNVQKDATAGSKKSAFCLSALAAQHQHVAVKPQPAKESKNVQSSEVIVPVTQASVFAKTLCSKYKVVQRESSCVPKKSRFSRKRQISSVEENVEVKHHKINPFDFLTPSPDDIIKEKQKAAFGRPGSNRSAASNDSSKPAVSTDPAPVAAAAAATAFPPAEPGVSQGVARMTFSANKQATTGFEKKPTKFVVGEAPPQATPEKSSNSTAGATGGPDNAPLMETPKRTSSSASLSALGTPGGLHKSSSKAKLEKLDMKAEYEKRKAGSKDNVNLVVIGHVDAGKSTLMGHTLYQLGFVNKRSMHKYEQEAKKMGKASFAYAWVLDETEEERSRGVTMDVAQTRFETDTKMVTLLDAPGHKDFIPNMITGAAQADVAILVVNAARGEFETGFEAGGQTREHALLIRSLGVSQLLVAVNKMDMVDWAQPRFTEITKKLGAFLKQAGFRESDLVYVPCSGLSGENLTKPSEVPDLVKWYRGPCIVQQIDKMRPPERPIDKPLRLCVTDIFKGQGAGFSVAGTLQSGCLQAGERVLVMPQGEVATAKGIVIDDLPAQTAFAGDNTVITLVGIEMNNIGIGSILCALNEPIQASSRYKARVVIFNIDIPITKGFPVVIHYQSLTEQGHIRKLVSQLHKSTGEVLKNKPRCLGKNSSAIVELEVSRPICMELYRNNKDLGRFMLRSAGHTIAAGLVTEIINRK